MLGLLGCGEEGSGNTVPGKQLIVYSSLPMQGPSRQAALDIADAERLALKQAGGKAGDYTIRYVSLNGATPEEGRWEPGQISSNARKAAGDRRTIAYLGELDPGSSAVSIPILNQAGILTVSAGDTAVGLTRSEGAGQDEPDKYYPEGDRSFGRVVPADHVQARAIALYMKDAGVTRAYLLNDEREYGRTLTRLVAKQARAEGIQVAADEAVDLRSADQRPLTAKIAASRATGVFFGGVLAPGVSTLYRDLHAAAPQLALFAPAAVASPAFVRALGPAQRMTFAARPELDPRLYPPAGQRFFKEFEESYGRVPVPEAAYGFEAMDAVLEAISEAGDRGNDRQVVRDAFFGTSNRESVLGTYSIDDNGDTTLADYGGYRIVNGRLQFDKRLEATP